MEAEGWGEQSGGPQACGDQRGQRVVDEELQEPPATGSSLARTAQAMARVVSSGYNTCMAKTRRFLVNLIFDREYNGYVADVPELPGCMSQGKTVEIALRNVRKAIAAYLRAGGSADGAQGGEVLTSQVEVHV